MIKYRIRLENGRVIGPFVREQLFELKTKGHIKGNEEAQEFPAGDWSPLASFDFYPDLMDENRTAINAPSGEETFIIDLAKLRQEKNEKEIESMEPAEAPLESLTETVRMTPSEVKIELQLDHTPAPSTPVELDLDQAEASAEEGFVYEEPEAESTSDKTLINPVAQQEIERMRRQQKEEEERQKAEEERLRLEEEARREASALRKLELEKQKADDSTQMIRLDKVKEELLEVAHHEEKQIEKEYKAVKKKLKAEQEEDEDEEEEDESKSKRKKLIVAVLVLVIGYAIMFPSDDKPKKPPFQHIPPQVIFPVPYDKADTKKSEIEYQKGVELFAKGGYTNIIKAGLLFRSSYENNLDNLKALNLLVRSFAEQINYSKQKEVDALTLFNLIQSKRPMLIQDPNGAIGLNLFYMAINKPEAAADVMAKYLKLNPKNVTQDLFAIYLKSLIKIGELDKARQFHQALVKAPEKNRYTFDALIDYYLLNQEPEKAEEYLDDAIKRNPELSYFYLRKADHLIRNKKFKEAIPYMNKAEELNLDYNDLNRAKFLELTGLLLAAQGQVQKATALLNESLRLVDSNDLRMKLAELGTTGGQQEATDKLIAESKAVKLLLQARDFYDKKQWSLAMSTAAKATDAYPGHIPSELFLSKTQLKLGLAEQGLKTLENLIKKYPDNKDVNFALLEGLIDTYKFNDAKNRIAIISGTDMKADARFASLNAKLYTNMGDSLQAISWLKAAVNMNPLNDEDLFRMAEALIKRANFDAARSLLNKCMELDPINLDYRIAYSKLIYETQDDQAAVGYLLGLQEEFGESPKLLSEIAIFYHRAGKVKDFLDYRAKLEKLPNKDKTLYEFLIRVARMDEKYEDIPALVEQLLRVEPGDLNHMMLAGEVLFESGKLIDAAKWFKRVQDRLPSYPKVQYYIARIKFLSGDLDAAMEEVKKDMKDNGESDVGLVFMAQIYEKKEEIIEAETYYKRAQKINPRNFEALMGLADISTKRNNFDQALDLYKRAMRQKSDAGIIHKKVGDVYRRLGQGALAIESYKLYLEMEPEASDKGQIESYINLMQ